MTTRPILVGYDGSDGARTAVSWALDEATRTGTPVELALAFDWPPPVMAPADAIQILAEDAHRDMRPILDAVIADAARTHPAVTVTGSVLEGPVTAMLLAQSRHASLVVLGSRGRGGFAGLLLGSTTVALSAHAHCPVVVVRGVDRGPQERPGHVVAGVDFSPGSLPALGFAFDQAAGRRVPLHIVHAWTPPPPRVSPPDSDPEEIVVAERTALTDLVAQWRAKYPDVPVTTRVIADTPARCLIEATRHAQLTVVGSRGRGGFSGLLLGSVSQQLLHHGHCPIAVVRDTT